MNFTGCITLIEGEYAETCAIKHAVLRGGGDIAFDFDYGLPGFPDVYTVAVSSTSNDTLEGSFSAGSGANRLSGTVTCRKYVRKSGIALVGSWFEGGNRYEWFAELVKETRRST